MQPHRVFGRFLLFVLLLATFASPALGERPRERALLYSRNASPELRQLVAALARRAPLPPDVPGCPKYFVRVLDRDAVLDGAVPRQGARLGRRPFVFVTTPAGISGRSLLDIELGLGYEASYVLRPGANAGKVAVIFRYASDVGFHDRTDGAIGDAGWEDRVVIPSWANVFALLRLLAFKDLPPKPASVDAIARHAQSPDDSCFCDDDRYFVIGFDETGYERVRTIEYAALRAAGGSEWRYRRLLERQLGCSELFAGTGRTFNETEGPDAPEFVGPNRALYELAEIAILDLGVLDLRDSYGER